MAAKEKSFVAVPPLPLFLRYMYMDVSHPVAHNNKKADNIFLDGELKIDICHCRRVVLRPLNSNNVKLSGRASQPKPAHHGAALNRPTQIHYSRSLQFG